MVSQRLYIVTGSTNGLGLEICKNLIKTDCIVLGISKSESKINNIKYHHLIHDFKNKINIQDFLKMKLDLQYEIYVILNATRRYDDEYNLKNYFDIFLTSFNVNFYNQIDFINKLSHNKKIQKILFISSYCIFTSGNQVRDIAYYLSKENYYKIILLIKKHHNINCQCIIIGSMKTKQLSQNPSTISKLPIIGKYLEKKLSISPNIAAKKVIKKLESQKNIILMPNIPIFITKFIVKIVELININK